MDQVRKNRKLKMMLRRTLPQPLLQLLHLSPNLNLKLKVIQVKPMPKRPLTKKFGKLSKLD